LRDVLTDVVGDVFVEVDLVADVSGEDVHLQRSPSPIPDSAK
jgi:hypothetical protein